MKLWLLFAGIFIGQHMYSQDEQVYFGSHTIHATQLCKEGKFEEAIVQIELAIQDSVDSSDFFTWYSRGFIYKELYKKQDAANPTSQNREIAVASFLKSRLMAGNVSEKTDNHDLALKYLANTYYNNALQSTLLIKSVSVDLGTDFMEKYCSIMQAIHHDEECPLAFADYYRARGQRYHELWSADEKDKKLWDSALADYRRALGLAQHDCSISYNITALYCNLLVTYRNDTTLATIEERTTLLDEAKTSMSITNSDCSGDKNYVDLISKGQQLLEDLTREMANSQQPSKK